MTTKKIYARIEKEKGEILKKICTVILDGYGWSENPYGNAVKMSPPNNFLELWNTYPHSLLEASEEKVGLEPNQFGNSEVGHLTIGAGRIVKQSISLIREYLETTAHQDEKFLEMIQKLKETKKNLHIIGLLSDGKVHSSLEHYLKLLDVLKKEEITNVYFHVISDGRDTGTKSLYQYISKLEEKIKETGIGKIASICGRYYAMDRDKNYERTKKYYDLIVNKVGIEAANIPLTIEACYEKKVTDEFLPPLILEDFKKIEEEDFVLWMNYRTDRAKQIISALYLDNFLEFETKPLNLSLYSFLPIDPKIKNTSFLEREVITNPLGVYLSKLGMTQARIAETEKYAHVTYFFDGESNGSLEGCQKFLIPSPKVATYDLKPEMSAIEVTKKVISCMEKDYDFILVNFANPDMVGHTGNLEATMKACITVDFCLKVLKEKAEDNFYTLVILADHGNADQMLDEQKRPVTTHTTSKVPFIITDQKINLKENGSLINVAPTILEYMEIAPPKEMRDTESLIKN